MERSESENSDEKGAEFKERLEWVEATFGTVPADLYPEMHLIFAAEDKVDGVSRGCYCVSCLERVAVAANEVVAKLVALVFDDEESKKLWNDYRFVVIKNGMYSSLVRGWKLDEYRYENWMKSKREGPFLGWRPSDG